jgi:uncharacterized damage-inducible protein DinB
MMENILLKEDIAVFGKEVPTFPLGIAEAFDSLAAMLPEGDSRPFYAISKCIDGKVSYKAAALQTFEGEAAQYGCERYTIEKGEYLSVAVKEWRQKISTIRAVFDHILKDDLVDRRSPAIEVYKNHNEMLCMVKIDPAKQLTAGFKSVTDAFVAALNSFDDRDLNTVTSHGTWSASQVAAHVHLSDKGMIHILKGKHVTTERDPALHVGEIKAEFLDFETKNQSPEFVRPANKIYNKARLEASFVNGRRELAETLAGADLNLIYEDFPFPGPDGMTGLELLSFIVYHTERHRHQLLMIKEKLPQAAAVTNS